MRDQRPNEDFGRMAASDKGWQRYTVLQGDEGAAFRRLFKSPRRAFLFAIFLGGFGVQRFYLGHYRTGMAILLLGLASLFVPLLWWIFAVVYLIEIGHIVRTTEQWNDSLEGALMLKTYSKPLILEKDAI